MTAPEIALTRFGWGCLLGVGLGIWYDFLRPPRRRHPHFWDLVFLLGCLRALLYLGFGICGGDLRFGYCAGLILGGLAWEGSLSRLIRPIFDGVWGLLADIWAVFWLPMKKFSIFAKFLFASAKKWVTIKCNNRQKIRRTSGGQHHGRKDKSLPQRAGNIPPQQAAYQDHRDCHHRIVYDCPGDPAMGSE